MPEWLPTVETLRSARSGARRVDADGRSVFLKTGPASSGDMFSAEAAGLAELSAPGIVRVPGVIACDVTDGIAFLALEWLDLDRPTRDAEVRFGRQLAALHAVTADRFGWHRDNTIGLTPQHNEWTDDWVSFFRERRLAFQLQLAADNGYAGALQQMGQRLTKRLPEFFRNYDPVPSLLHGDLWGGNWASCGEGPVTYDPAVYYGDRETDLAMTRLFGGFGAAFYEAYESRAPLSPGYEQRCDLYQLYHVLNHLNLFGGAYHARALQLLDNLLEEGR